MMSLLDNFENITPEVQAENERQYQLAVQAEDEKIRQNWFENKSGVNARYWKESLDTYIPETEEEKTNLDYIKKYVAGKSSRKMLLIIGKYGTGKTHLGAGIIKATYGLFTSSTKICLEYEMGSDYNAKRNRLEVLEYYSQSSNLVIDEIGRANSQYESKVLEYIINQRYENNLPLVMISNLEKNKVIELLGEPITDRLQECCSTLTFNGRSRRNK